MTVDLSGLYGFLGLDEQEGPRELLYAARVAHYTLPYLVLSAVEQAGLPLGPASADELARARERAATYDRLLAELAEAAGATPVKGPLLSRWYPPGLLRAQGDLDVLVPDEARLWRAVRLLADRQPAAELTVTLFGRGHLMVGVSWDAADHLSDPPYRVELATAALTGDFGPVPVRVRLPDDPVLAALLGLAEELLQRPAHARDLIDVAVLGGAAPVPPVAELVAAVSAYRLAPELAGLLDRTVAVHPLGRLAGVPEALAPAVAAELDRRAARPAPDPGADVAGRLAAGQPVYGMPLTAGRPDRATAALHRGPWGTILRTPVGDHLLVGGPRVDPAAYELALAESARLATGAAA